MDEGQEQFWQQDKQIEVFQKYLAETGLSMAFQIIFAELLAKKVQPVNVFTYTAMRLRQIGEAVGPLLPGDLTEGLRVVKQ